MFNKLTFTSCFSRENAVFSPKRLWKWLLEAKRFASFWPLAVGSETFCIFRHNNVYIVGLEARRFASCYPLAIGSETFRFVLLIDCWKTVRIFRPNNVYILCAWKRDVSLLVAHRLLEAKRFASFS